MREILFRGKQKDNGQWVEGFFVNCCSTYDDPETDRVAEIIEVNADRIYKGEYCHLDVYPVDPETVGQFTEFIDKNDNKIFEGDIVNASWGYKGLVELDSLIYASMECRISDDIEVIGNIHDNPELLSVLEVMKYE